jgi:hypothetical protein
MTLIFDLLIISAPIIASLGVVRTIIQIIRKELAERHLLSLLVNDKKRLQELEVMKPRLLASPIDAETFNETNKILGALVAQLGEEDKKQLMEGLSQPSEKSRVNYIVKLVTEGEREAE